MRQVTFFEDSDIHFPSIGPQDIVFENDGRLYLLDLATEKQHEVDIKVVPVQEESGPIQRMDRSDAAPLGFQPEVRQENDSP